MNFDKMDCRQPHSFNLPNFAMLPVSLEFEKAVYMIIALDITWWLQIIKFLVIQL